MEEHELINGKPNEQEAEKPSETIFQIKDDEWKKAVEIILGIDKHEKSQTRTHLISSRQHVISERLSISS